MKSTKKKKDVTVNGVIEKIVGEYIIWFLKMSVNLIINHRSYVYVDRDLSRKSKVLVKSVCNCTDCLEGGQLKNNRHQCLAFANNDVLLTRSKHKVINIEDKRAFQKKSADNRTNEINKDKTKFMMWENKQLKML